MGNALIGPAPAVLSRRPTRLARPRCWPSSEGADGVQSPSLRQHGKHAQRAGQGRRHPASGGFNRHPVLRAQMPFGADPAWCPGAPGHTGAAQDVRCPSARALRRGGGMSHSFWAPVIDPQARRRHDGVPALSWTAASLASSASTVPGGASSTKALLPPVALAMQESHKTVPSVPTFLVADAPRVSGKPGGVPRRQGAGTLHRRWLHLTRGESRRTGRQARHRRGGLADSVKRNNAYAQTGIDADSGRGSTGLPQRHNGETPPRAGKRSLPGAIATAPFYVLRPVSGRYRLGDGIVAVRVRVLGTDDVTHRRPPPTGTDMPSVFGVYVAPGITLGPNKWCSFIAAQDAVARAGVGSAA